MIKLLERCRAVTCCIGADYEHDLILRINPTAKASSPKWALRYLFTENKLTGTDRGCSDHYGGTGCFSTERGAEAKEPVRANRLLLPFCERENSDIETARRISANPVKPIEFVFVMKAVCQVAQERKTYDSAHDSRSCRSDVLDAM